MKLPLSAIPALEEALLDAIRAGNPGRSVRLARLEGHPLFDRHSDHGGLKPPEPLAERRSGQVLARRCS